MLIDYWHFARTHTRFLGFGFLLAFLSSPGQTYFIGVFGSEIQALFDLDSGAWGRTYMMGTLLSAVVITWSGTLIDRMDLRWFTTLSLIGLVCACLVIGSVSSPVMLVVGIFMLRDKSATTARMLPVDATNLSHAIGNGVLTTFLLCLCIMSFLVYGPLVLMRLYGMTPFEAGAVVMLETLAWGSAAIIFSGVRPEKEGCVIRLGSMLVVTGLIGNITAWRFVGIRD